MRVLQLTKFYAPFRGGIESVVQALTRGLEARGMRTDVLCAMHTPGPTSRETLNDSTKVTRVHSFGKLLSTSIAPAILAELSRVRSAYEVIHVHLPDPLTNLALCVTRPTAKLVVHWHSDVIHQRAALRLYAPLQNWLLNRADAIIVTSKAYGDFSPWLTPFRRKLHVVPIGIDDLETSPKRETIADLRRRYPGSKLIFSLGRMVYYKGFKHLIEAATHLPSDYNIIIGGSGELLPTLRQQCAIHRLEDRVFFVGNIPDGEISAYFAAADLFCLPSVERSEAFGVVLLEAMRAGKPVVATCIEGSGVPWVNVHGETGLNVPTADAPALASAIRHITEQPDLAAQFGRAARARYLAAFTSDLMVEQVSHLYRCLLSSPSTGPG